MAEYVSGSDNFGWPIGFEPESPPTKSDYFVSSFMFSGEDTISFRRIPCIIKKDDVDCNYLKPISGNRIQKILRKITTPRHNGASTHTINVKKDIKFLTKLDKKIVKDKTGAAVIGLADMALAGPAGILKGFAAKKKREVVFAMEFRDSCTDSLLNGKVIVLRSDNKQFKSIKRLSKAPSKSAKEYISNEQSDNHHLIFSVSKESRPLQRGEPSKIIETGKHSYGIQNITIRSFKEGAHLYIGSFCSIAKNQKVFLGGNHRTDWITTFPFGHILHKEFPNGYINGQGHPSTKGHVFIHNDVWIGDNCTIMSGISIGSGSVIASGSVVVKDVAPYTIVGGNPAKFIKHRFPQHISERLLEIKWWDKSDEHINKIVPLLQQIPSGKILQQINTIIQS